MRQSKAGTVRVAEERCYASMERRTGSSDRRAASNWADAMKHRPPITQDEWIAAVRTCLAAIRASLATDEGDREPGQLRIVLDEIDVAMAAVPAEPT